jgi:Na+-driven multidrug efflux pump
MSVTAIKLFSFSYLVGWIDMCFSSYFTALERPGRSLVVSFFGTLFFPISCLFILTPIFGLNGVWLMPTVSAIASGILTLILAISLKTR